MGARSRAPNRERFTLSLADSNQRRTPHQRTALRAAVSLPRPQSDTRPLVRNNRVGNYTQAALAEVPGFRTSTLRAFGEPTLRMPTLSYLADVR